MRLAFSFISSVQLAGVSNFKGLALLAEFQRQQALRQAQLKAKQLESNCSNPNTPSLRHTSSGDTSSLPPKLAVNGIYNWGVYRYMPYLVGCVTQGTTLHLSFSEIPNVWSNRCTDQEMVDDLNEALEALNP